jgi:hypothetical protein
MSSVWHPSLAHLSKRKTQLRSRKLTRAKAQNPLQEIARASGGRAYAPENMIDLSATYDDKVEDLKVRYVITYRSSSDGDLAYLAPCASNLSIRTTASLSISSTRTEKPFEPRWLYRKATSPRLPPAGESLSAAVLGY